MPARILLMGMVILFAVTPPASGQRLVPDSLLGYVGQCYQRLYFTSQGLGYAASDRSLLRTRDFGKTWVLLLDGQRDAISGFTDLVFVDSETLYAYTAAETLLQSSDRGSTFTRLPTEVARIDDPGETATVTEGFFFLNSSQGWGLARDLFLITRDGGRTWGRVRMRQTVQEHGAPTKLWMFDEHRGIGVGGRHVIRTLDGGGTWAVVPDSPALDDARCVSSGFCLGRSWSVAAVYVTTDAGQTWQRIETGLDEEKDELHDFQVIAPGDAVLVGSHNDVAPAELREKRGGTTFVHAGPPDRGLLVRWRGGTWERREYPEVERFWAVYYVDDNEVWGSADTNGIIHSTDGARTWTFVPDYYRQIAALTPSRTPFVFPTPLPTP